MRNRQEAVPTALRDRTRLDERVHNGLVMLENELEYEVGDNETQEDERNQQRWHVCDSLFPQHEKKQKLQQPEIGDDDDLSDQSLVLLTEELAEAKTRQDTNRVYSHSSRKMESQTLKDPLRTPLFL